MRSIGDIRKLRRWIEQVHALGAPEAVEETTWDPDVWVGGTVAALTFLDPSSPKPPTAGGRPTFDDLCALLRLTAARAALDALKFVLGELSDAQVTEEVEQRWIGYLRLQLAEDMI